jgi:hypothetical protein
LQSPRSSHDDPVILSYVILSYVILSYVILSYVILSYVILSYVILSYVILSLSKDEGRRTKCGQSFKESAAPACASAIGKRGKLLPVC